MAWSLTEGDIKFFYTDSVVLAPKPADIAVSGYDLYRDPGFETAVLISLFSDARASDADPLPGSYTLRGGFWGSELLGFQLGSKLWLLGRSKIDNTTIALLKQYCKDALAWMIEDKIASSVDAEALHAGGNTVNFVVQIIRVSGQVVTFKFFANWEAQIIGGLEI